MSVTRGRTLFRLDSWERIMDTQTKSKSKNKDDGFLENEQGKVKGHSRDPSLNRGKDEGKKRAGKGTEDKMEDREPIIKKPALMRTPPTGKAPPLPDPKDSSAGLTLEEKPQRGVSGKERDQEKRKRQEDSPVEGSNRSQTEMNQVEQDRRCKTIIRSPLKKIGRRALSLILKKRL